MKIVTAFLILTCVNTAYSQSPDLVIYFGGFTPATVNRGEILTISAAVQNVGNAVAGNSHLGFYISPSVFYEEAVWVGAVSVEPLGPGAISESKSYVFSVPGNFSPGSYYVGYYADYYGEVTESDERNAFYTPGFLLTVTSGVELSLHIPYPVILVHGLVSNDQTWNSFSTWLEGYGYSNGGRMDFCLNFDANLTTGLLANDYHDFTLENNLKPADFYLVNFDVNPDGSVHSNTVQSNQSAIVKQGVAMHDAIKHVLNVTKKDKVILVGHSMGGLAAREYLQNPANWQSDGQHHVAKLLTIGTPHGGSNAWTFGSIDGYSEAVRDLRWSYSNGSPGVYLFGGNENDKATIGFHNTDVNCNGQVGDSIVGLDQKSIPSIVNLMYSCVIGTGGLSGDGVVDAARANLNNYSSLLFPADTFLVNATHTNLPSSLYVNMKGLDEPAYFTQAYKIDFDSLYYGLITKQSNGSPSSYDFDDYEFTVNTTGMLHLSVKNIPISSLKVEVFDSLYNSKAAVFSNSLSKIDTLIQLEAGKYYFEVSGLSDAYSWMFPYAFKISFTPVVSVENPASKIPSSFSLSQNYPNPFNPTTAISFDISQKSFVTLKVYDLLGREVATIINQELPPDSYTKEFDASSLSSGVYLYRLTALHDNHLSVFSEKMVLLR